MSMNLNLHDAISGCECKLFQTPTEDTYRILEGKTEDERLKLYIAWLKEYRRDGRKKLPESDLRDIRDHELKIIKFLAGHPFSKFGAI